MIVLKESFKKSSMKSVVAILLLLISSVSQAGKHQHTEGSRMGSHGMAMLTDGEHIYASHMPLYFAPHDVQLIYKVSLFQKADALKKNNATKEKGIPEEKYALQQKESVLNALSNKLVTLLPENFDLNLLINGESMEVTAKIYDGHFERGGKVWFENVVIKFESQIYKRMLIKEQLDASSDKANYDFIELPQKQTSKQQVIQKKSMVIRQITAPPSVDHILILSRNSELSHSGSEGCNLNTKTENLRFDALPELSKQQKFIEKRFDSCSTLTGRYWETADFVAR